MSQPVYWSQPNQQVVRDGDPVGIISDDPDPQAEAEVTKSTPTKKAAKKDAPDEAG